MADATWRAGFARLAPLNLTFEAWLYHPQLMELADLARAFPQTTIILNHVDGPLGIGPYADKKKETFAAWKAGIAELGKYQNVVVKLGGLGMLFGMFDFHSRETPRRRSWRAPTSPISRHASWRSAPTAACLKATSRRTASVRATPSWWNAFKQLAAGYSADERARLFSGTAKRVYRLA